MAISIQNVLYSVGMDTNGLEIGAQKVSGIRGKMAKEQEQYAKRQQKNEKDIERAVQSRERQEKALAKAQEKLDKMRSSGATNDALLNQTSNIENIKDKIEELTKREQKLRDVRATSEKEYNKLLEKNAAALKLEDSLVSKLASSKKLLALSASLTALAGVGVAAWGRQEQAIKSLESVLDSSGYAVDEYSKKFQDLASAIQGMTTYGDEVILENTQLALSMGITADKMEEFQKGAIGLATAQGKTLPEASRALAKAFQGNFEALQDIIPAIKNAKTEEEKLAILNEKMAEGFKLAQDQASTLTGALKQAGNIVGDVGEEIGKELAPHVIRAAKAVKGFAEWFLNLSEWQKTFIIHIGGVVAILPALSRALKVAHAGLLAYQSGMLTAAAATNALKVALIKSGLGIAIVAVGEAAFYLFDKLGGLADGAEESAEGIDKAADAAKRAKGGLEEMGAAAAEAEARFEELKEIWRQEDEAAGIVARANAELARYDEERLSLNERIERTKERIAILDQKQGVESGDAVKEANIYAEKVREILNLKRMQAERDKQAADEAKKAADEAKKARDDAAKQVEEEARKAAEKQKQILEARREFELNLKIEKLEKSGRTREAEAIKNAIRRNELMEKYGYDIEQATKALKAQKELESGGKVEYSKKDVERAKKIIERGEGGTVGKKTMEQARAIVEGRKIEGDELAAFSGATKRAKTGPEMAIARLPEAGTGTAAKPAKAAEAVKTEAQPKQKKEDESAQKLDAILKGIETMTSVLKEAFA